MLAGSVFGSEGSKISKYLEDPRYPSIWRIQRGSCKTNPASNRRDTNDCVEVVKVVYFAASFSWAACGRNPTSSICQTYPPTHPSTHRPKSLFVIYLYPLSLPDLSKGPEVVNKCKFSNYLTCKTVAIISNTLEGKSGLCTSEILDKHPTLFSSIFSGNNQSTTNTAPAQISCVTSLCVVFIRNIRTCTNSNSVFTHLHHKGCGWEGRMLPM